MKAGEKLVVFLGLGFAAWVIAQTVFRYGAEDDGDIRGSDKFMTKTHKQVNKAIAALGKQIGVDWYDINVMLADDAPAFDSAVAGGASEDRPGVIEEIGNTGRLYTWLNGRPVLLVGSAGPAR